MDFLTESVAQRISEKFRKATRNPQLMDDLLEDEEFRQFLIERDIALRSESRNEGKIQGIIYPEEIVIPNYIKNKTYSVNKKEKVRNNNSKLKLSRL